MPICQVSAGLSCAAVPEGEAMPAWSAQWQYFRPRVEGEFLRFFWSPDHRTWRVQSKSGVTMEFGVPLDGTGAADALEADPAASERVFRWHLARSYDTQGTPPPAGEASPRPVNVVRYRYENIGGVAYLSDVYDTPPASVAASAPLSSYAHHAQLVYEARPDVTFSYRSGWRTEQGRRLRRVDVTSKAFAGTGPRELLRRYHLSYDPAYNASLLLRVQTEGRCAQPVVEDPSGGLGATNCPRLPALGFGYQHVEPFRSDGSPGVVDLPGFEGFDERLRAFEQSPPHSLSDPRVDLYDVNADSLPDVLATDVVTYGGKHGVFLNSSGGVLGRFAQSSISVAPTATLPANATTLDLTNDSLSMLDVDGNGLTDLLYMPFASTYGLYSPKPEGAAWRWAGRAITTASGQLPRLDLANSQGKLRILDVNADGLVDIVVAGGTQIDTYFALGRYPNGEGRFGHASWTGAASADLSDEPTSFCLPFSDTLLNLADADTFVGDMNGDGLPDLVRVRLGSVVYWPGRGNGFWGAGEAANCPPGGASSGNPIFMDQDPFFTPNDPATLRLDDVNGDGLDDLVQVNSSALKIWLNVDGKRWTAQNHLVDNTPLTVSSLNRFRLTDVNGSGTRDALWGSAFDYRYIDLSGGKRPWLLTSVSNGLGKTTEFDYTSSTELMLSAAKAGHPWGSVSPAPMHVITRIVERDGLPAAGAPAAEHVVEYGYRDPVFDGRQREFRGFRSASSKRLGDANSPSALTSTAFLLGECVDDAPGDSVDPCSPGNRWRDNPREALKGQPSLVEASNEAGAYFSTVHTTYRLRRLYTGLDGREVRYAFASATDGYLYDTSPFSPVKSTVMLPAVESELSPGAVTPDQQDVVTLRSATGRKRVRSSVNVDIFGNATDQQSRGCVEGCISADETITVHTEPGRSGDDLSGWLWRTTERYVTGSRKPADRREHTWFTYNTAGSLLSQRVELSGTLPLDRSHAVEGTAVAPAPPDASTDGIVESGSMGYDDFGNATRFRAPNGRCRDVTYDPTYATLPVSETSFVGDLDGGTGCGATRLTTSATYDRGLALVIDSVGLHGEHGKVDYDGFGRVLQLWKPHPTQAGAISALPSATIEYLLTTDPAVRPYSLVHTRTQDGRGHDVASYRDAWAYVDGMGRTRATLTQGDPSAGDGGAWVVGGVVTYDAKGAVERSYEPWFYDDEPATFPLSAPPPSSSTRQRYDAFGRSLETYGLDGQLSLRLQYHALAYDSWDAADVGPGLHQSTPASQHTDGHGRTVRVVERVHAGTRIEEREVVTDYLPTGEPASITRRVLGPQAASFVRWMRYDSLGRCVLNAEPHASKNFSANPATDPSALRAWRYAYNDNSELVGTSDARGCGVNVHRDAGGRFLAEDVSPCEAHHPAYTPPSLATGDGTEAFVRYDYADPEAADVVGFGADPSLYLGRVVSSSDRVSKAMTAYDGRGRTRAIAKRVAKPDAPEASLSERYAPRWYLQHTSFDGADRPVTQSTGARAPELLGTNNESALAVTYAKNGAVRRVGGSYGVLVDSVIHDADGAITFVRYGDAAATNTTVFYDARRRVETLRTQRGAPAFWSAPPPAYQPPPAPGGTSSSFQLRLQDISLSYDEVDNPTQIRDLRNADEWPQGAKPVDRTMQYDDLYRLTQINHQYAGGDAWVSPFAAENAGDEHPQRAAPSPHVAFATRVLEQRFTYDWLGNQSSNADDTNGFYDRSLGTITNGFASGKPYQLVAASNEAVPSTGVDRRGHLSAAYDDAGHLTSLSVARRGPCLPVGSHCAERFTYEWDETGHLARARRWDLATPDVATAPLPAAPPAAELHYAYDGAGGRVRKTAVDGSGGERHTLYVFGSLELRRASYAAEGPSIFDYTDDAETEAVTLGAGGQRLGRLWFEPAALPAPDGARLHVFLTLPDLLGSSSIVIDKATGELVEASTYQAYGAVESDYRPERWQHYRDDYRFTGKEDDIEVGLSYFGARYYAPALGRWASADPLTVHELGSDLNAYAYVHGRVLQATDPLGLSAVSSGASAPATALPSPETGGGIAAPPTTGTAPPASAPAAPPPAPFSIFPLSPAAGGASESAGAPSLSDSFLQGLTEPAKDLGALVLEKAQVPLVVAQQLANGDGGGALETYTSAVGDNLSMVGQGLLNISPMGLMYHSVEGGWNFLDNVAHGRWNAVAESAGNKAFEGLSTLATEGVGRAFGELGGMAAAVKRAGKGGAKARPAPKC